MSPTEMRSWTDKLVDFLAELRRRKVFKVASVYSVTAWGASMGASSLLPAFGAPAWAVPLFVVVAVLGLPIAIALAWAYELGPGGKLQPDQSRVGIVPVGGARPGEATRLMGDSSVRVSWRDSHGQHERTFAHDFRIGRDVACEVHLDDPLISRRHAEISHVEGLWWVRDLGSRNGTMLEGRRVSRAPLPAQCEIRLHSDAPSITIKVVSSPDARTVTASRVQGGDMTVRRSFPVDRQSS